MARRMRRGGNRLQRASRRDPLLPRIVAIERAAKKLKNRVRNPQRLYGVYLRAVAALANDARRAGRAVRISQEVGKRVVSSVAVRRRTGISQMINTAESFAAAGRRAFFLPNPSACLILGCVLVVVLPDGRICALIGCIVSARGKEKCVRLCVGAPGPPGPSPNGGDPGPL
jgi:hypothetical protein